MQPWILTKLSYGILKESLLHPRAILVLDKTSGRVSRGEDNTSLAVAGVHERPDIDLLQKTTGAEPSKADDYRAPFERLITMYREDAKRRREESLTTLETIQHISDNFTQAVKEIAEYVVQQRVGHGRHGISLLSCRHCGRRLR